MELVRRVADNEAIKMRMVPFLAPSPWIIAALLAGPCCNERKMDVWTVLRVQVLWRFRYKMYRTLKLIVVWA